MERTAPLALTSGEPAGIGPDLCLAVAMRARSWPLVCLADRAMLEQRARLLGLQVRLEDWSRDQAAQCAAGALSVLHQPLAAPAIPENSIAPTARPCSR